MSSKPDEILARESLAGNQQAFEELVSRYERVVYTLAIRMVGGADDARDITQVVFVKAWRGLSGFDQNRRFFSWIYRISIHECLNHRRRVSRFEPLSDHLVSKERGPEDRAARREVEDRVQQAMEQLSREDRELLILRHYLDQSYEEIAETLQVPAKTVKSRLFTARQRLRGELIRQGVREP